MIKKTLLLCMTDLPFPARRNGISIRYFPIIEHAFKSYDIHLLIISDVPSDPQALALARQWCNKISFYERKKTPVSIFNKLLSRIKTLLPTGIPFTHLRYDESEISTFLANETRDRNYDLALCVLLPYLNLVKKHVTYNRLTLDLIDSPYSTAARLPKNNFLDLYDTWMIKHWEKTALATVDYACYISPLDRALGAGKKFNPLKIGVIPNGLYLQNIVEEKINYQAPTIGYLGHMGYKPNIQAALRLAGIYKKLKGKLPSLKLIIIGRDPDPAIKALEIPSEIVVTGTVDNIWPYVQGVDLFVFPMEIGSGQQNKLLEAMGVGKAVISTTLGNSGVGAIPNKHLIEANTDEAISEAILQLMTDKTQRDTLGNEAREFIRTTYLWDTIHTKLDEGLLA